MNPVVSVVIPTHNRADYLCEAIESVLRQTVAAVEVIVIDDGSTDHTPAVVARYAPDVRYIWQPNAERGAARNHGLRQARGEFVAFLDSDDVWTADKLAYDLDLFARRPELGLVYSDIELIDARGASRGVRRRARHDGWVTSPLLRENFVILSAHLARTAAIREAGGFREERLLSGSEDWELWVRLSTHWQFGHVAATTTRYRVHAGNSMSSAVAMERSMLHACAIMERAGYLTREQRRLLPHTRAMVSLFCAINYHTAGEQARSWRHLREATRHSSSILLDPRFAYTGLRNLLPPLLSASLRQVKQRMVASWRSPSRSNGSLRERVQESARP